MTTILVVLGAPADSNALTCHPTNPLHQPWVPRTTQTETSLHDHEKTGAAAQETTTIHFDHNGFISKTWWESQCTTMVSICGFPPSPSLNMCFCCLSLSPLSRSLSIYLSMLLPYLSIYLSIHPRICLSMDLSVFLYVVLSFLFFSFLFFFFFSLSLSLSLTLCVSLVLSLFLSVSHAGSLYSLFKAG